MYEKVMSFIKFLLIGGSMTILNFILYVFFIEILEWQYIVSNGVSYVIPVIFSYFLNEKIAFKCKNENGIERIKKLVRFIIMKLVLLILDSIVLSIFVSKLNMGKYLAKITNTVIFTIVSYSITKRIVGVKNECV